MTQPHDQHENPAETPKPILGFVAWTPIRTSEGSKRIEELQPGDIIQSQPDDEQGDHKPEDHEDDRPDDDLGWWEWN
jgi:hypothetical protein